MKINNYVDVLYPDLSKVNNNDNNSRITFHHPIECSSADILSNQGKAQLMMSFKGALVPPKMLSNEDFQKLQQEFKEKTELLPNRAKSYAKYWHLNRVNIECAVKVVSDERLYDNENFFIGMSELLNSLYDPKRLDLLNKVLNDDKYLNNKPLINNIANIISKSDTPDKVKLAEKILEDDNLLQNETFLNKAAEIIHCAYTPEDMHISKKIISDERLYNNESFLNDINSVIHSFPEQKELISTIFSNEKFLDNEFFMENAPFIIYDSNNPEKKVKNLHILHDKEIMPSQKFLVISNSVKEEDIKKLNKVMGKEKAGNLEPADMIIAAKFVDVYQKQNTDELTQRQKREFLNNLVAANSSLFNLSDTMKEMFPILPTSQEKYCTMLSSFVKKLHIKVDPLNDEEIKKFHNNLKSFVSKLYKLSDKEFENLKIDLKYPKNEFIKDILDKVKELPDSERTKVYEYFGFELVENENASYKTAQGTGISLLGMPVDNYENYKNVQISDEKTKKTVELLKENVIKFSKNNKVICSNKEIEEEINNIITVLPALISTIGNIQAGMNGTKGHHQFDIFKHSIKVMHEIIKTDEYKELNDSDKKVILLAALLHDTKKNEGSIDAVHASKSSFDAYFSAKKFKLSAEEEIKLYNLVKNHEWLQYVNTAKSQQELDKRLKSVAYDLRHDNMFDIALLFAHADLKGVNITFHDGKEGNLRCDFNGTIRSFGESADLYGGIIKKYINQLKNSQPLLPVTQIPKASTIENAITEVNEDGSTNIKGVYKDKDGLIVLKYNELQNEDLEKIGFPSDSLVNGINTVTEAEENIDTGNIKFFVHGLNFPSQLAKFNAFSLVDSDVLLSVSYSECPESKYKFFRQQGILLDCATKYIHGGGKNDSGSGYGKNIEEFKNNYIFGGERESDRNYVSDLIKSTLNLNNEEYIKFVKENENKSMSEIEPIEVRNKLIRAFSNINSSIIGGKRDYNEMYISNPKPPMAVFAYSKDDDYHIENPIDFLNRTEISKQEKKYLSFWHFPEQPVKDRTSFLRNYALKHDLPFIVFGN